MHKNQLQKSLPQKWMKSYKCKYNLELNILKPLQGHGQKIKHFESDIYNSKPNFKKMKLVSEKRDGYPQKTTTRKI